MASTYSPSLRIELIGAGEQAGTWNTTTNTNLGTLIEASIAGFISVPITSANQALTALDGAPDQSRNAIVSLTTTTGANFNVYAPPQEKQYIIWNNSSYTATIYNSTVLGNTTAAGLGVAVPAGKRMVIFTTGQNFYTTDAENLTGILPVSNGGTGVTTSTGTGSLVLNDSPTLISATLTTPALGTPASGTLDNCTSNTEAPGTDNTQLANTAFVTAAVNLTQTAANITGGSITGITDLAVADGGTGASTASDARTNLGLAIGTDVLAPNGDGSALTSLNASAISSGTVPVTNSGSLRLITKNNVYTDTPSNLEVITVSLPTSLFGGNTPSFVMFSASAQRRNTSDMRYFFMCSGNASDISNMVLASSSDDTDQGNTAQGAAASTFVLPYSASQQFYCALQGGDLYINVIGYQV